MRYRLGTFLGAVPLALATRLATAQVAPPERSVHVFDLAADGVQIYACQTREGGPGWVFQGPEAVLFDGTGRQVGTHGAGPHWIVGGERVTAAVVSNAPAPAAGAIPWLLLRVTPSTSAGNQRGYSFIRRFDTVGGTAPAGACTPGDVARMRYSASYGFYTP
ncbi:MAG: DUF3455 domain-containing protein [Pseudomonadota bacterium]